ncbi:MAG TPA: LuxR C-terminal-related transcriptional regulator [Candidatus Limnocylindrales bacterium]|nr:LuxR C-terminal-related transcriptional regulator [Candidatus Limnocylindrales bacterium]
MPGRVVSRRFIGREGDLARVEAAIAGAARGASTTVLIAGSAGMGASRFLDQVLERTAGTPEPPLILRGRAYGPVDPPWASVLEAIAPLLATRPDDELLTLLRRDARPLLVGLPRMAALAVGLPDPPRSELEDPERRQPRALEALLRWLGRVAAERPIVLALEDLQVADSATRAFATFVSRTAREERLSLILTWQPDRLTREHPLRENLAVIEAGLRPPVRVDLAALTRREIAALIEGIEGERPSASVVVLVAERSAGSPLVVEELIAARRELRHVSITGTLGDLIIARLARRSPECRRVLRLLAPSQRPMDRDRLARTAAAFEIELAATNGNTGGRAAPRSTSLPRRGADGLDADLAAGLAEALEHGFVIQEADERLRVRHELVARAVVTDLLPTQRPRYRAALAHAFEDVPVVASHHWRTANRPAEARAAAFEAGRIALSLQAPLDALHALEIGLELPAGAAPAGDGTSADGGGFVADAARGSGERASLAAIAQLAAEAAAAAGRPARAAVYAESALSALGERKDRLQHAVIEARLGRYLLAAGDAQGATAALRKAADVVPPGPSVERARILALLAQERMLAAAFRDAERIAREAIDVAAAVGEAAEPEAVHALTTLAVANSYGDAPETAVDLLREALARAEAHGLIDEAMRASANLTHVLELLGRPGEAIDEAYRGIAAARDVDLGAVYGNLLGGNAAGVLLEVGRWAECRELLLRAIDWSPSGSASVNALVNLATLEIEAEAGEEATRLLGRVLVELETGGDEQLAVPAYQATAAIAMWSRDLVDARRAAERGWSRLKGTEDWVAIARMAATSMEVEAAIVAEALEKRRIGDVAASRERAGRILAEAETAVARALAEDPDRSDDAEARLATARAFHARLTGREDPAQWAAVAQQWQEIGQPYNVAMARWHQAEATMSGAVAGRDGSRLDARLVRADAREPLSEAVAIALQLHARPMLRELRELAGRALIQLPPEVDELLDEPAPPSATRLPPAASPPLAEAQPAGAQGRGAGGPGGDSFGLSKRELEVLALISQGRTNREIGDRLFISQKTVGVHVGNILAKLGVSGRVEAAAVAIRLGLEGNARRPA